MNTQKIIDDISHTIQNHLNQYPITNPNNLQGWLLITRQLKKILSDTEENAKILISQETMNAIKNQRSKE